MPMMPFIGVRISWLMLARNSDFRRADSTAASRASLISSSIRFWSVMSWSVPTIIMGRPSPPEMTFLMARMTRNDPSGRTTR